MNKIVDKMGKWTKNAWDNGTVVMNDVCIVSLNENFEHTHSDMNEFITDKVRQTVDSVCDFEKQLEVPTVKDIKSEISELCGRKRSLRVLYCFGEDLPCVNARYMLELIDCLKVYEIKYESPRQPLVFKGKLGTGILLPVANFENKKGYKLVG